MTDEDVLVAGEDGDEDVVADEGSAAGRLEVDSSGGVLHVGDEAVLLDGGGLSTDHALAGLGRRCGRKR